MIAPIGPSSSQELQLIRKVEGQPEVKSSRRLPVCAAAILSRPLDAAGTGRRAGMLRRSTDTLLLYNYLWASSEI